MKIVIDLDSTIINTSKTLLNIYNNETDNDIAYNEQHNWDFEGLFPSTYNERAYALFTDTKFYDFIEVMPNAIDVINELAKDKNNEIIIATKHHPLRRPNTLKWIEENLQNVSICFLDSFDKSSLNGDIFIDDRIDCLESVENNFKYIICYGTYSWNKSWQKERINNWKELKEFIINIGVKKHDNKF